MRIDKWLWAARFFKTRALAAKACELGRVESRNQPLKAAREVKPGDLIRIKTEGGIYEIDVLALSEVRGPAAVAQTLYQETQASRKARATAAVARRDDPFRQPLRPPGRPSKRDRRLIHRFNTED
ncbi:MAG: RNA-binding S4 domain-containing protein [Acidobacteriaceae bacterium]